MQLPRVRPEAISIVDFLPILVASEVKLELIDGQVVVFAGGTVAHKLIGERIARALSGAAPPGCRVFTSDMALRRADAPTYVFPDAAYTSEAVDPDADSISAPSLIVEVISPQSLERDRVDKLDSYLAMSSVQEYLIVDSRRIWACVYRRSGTGWILTVYGISDTIELSSIHDMSLGMTELYAGTGRSVEGG